jgi:hypothetical protein
MPPDAAAPGDCLTPRRTGAFQLTEGDAARTPELPSRRPGYAIW